MELFLQQSSYNNNFAAILPTRTIIQKIPTTTSVSTAKLHAIWSALAGLGRYKTNNFVLYSDSRSALQNVYDPFTMDHRHLAIQWKLRFTDGFIYFRQEERRFRFVGLLDNGNEEADGAIRGIVHNRALPHKDYFPHFCQKLFNQWRTLWILLGMINFAILRKTCLSGQHRAEERD